jgi:hypothetical protein
VGDLGKLVKGVIIFMPIPRAAHSRAGHLLPIEKSQLASIRIGSDFEWANHAYQMLIPRIYLEHHPYAE